MPLKKATNKVEILEIDGSEIHAIKPTKAGWDDYVDELFDRQEGGELKTRSGRGIRQLYRSCVKKIVNVDTEKDGVAVSGVTLTDTNEIVDFLAGINDLSAGRKIDTWLLGLGDLTKEEAKN